MGIAPRRDGVMPRSPVDLTRLVIRPEARRQVEGALVRFRKERRNEKIGPEEVFVLHEPGAGIIREFEKERAQEGKSG